MSDRASTPQTKVFISYSRKDKEFTRQLYDGLAAHQLENWVDWEGIPLTADWMREIRDAIETADAFLMVISPDSLDSDVVTTELEIAVKNNKRLVPIVRRQPREDQFPKLNKSLASTNWTFMRKEDDFDATLKVLVDAIKMDLEWVKSHTRFQARALEWEREKRDPSYCLHGIDLEHAELWLSTNHEDRVPQPSKLQNEYILASRQEEARRQETVRNLILGALVISIVLGVLAVTQWFAADRQKNLAISRQLAAQALINRDSAPDLAPLLSIEALNFANNVDTRTSLLAILAENPELERILHGHVGGINAIAYDPQGRWIVSADTANLIYFWDPGTGTLLQTLGLIQVKDEETGEITTTTNHNGTINALDFNPSGTLLATADSNGRIIIWDLTSATIRNQIEAHGSAVNTLEFIDDTRLASGSADSTIKLWKVDIGLELDNLLGHTGSVLALDYHPKNEQLASSSSTGEVRLWDIKNRFNLPLEVIGHTEEVNAVSFSPDGTTLATAGRDQRILMWNTADGTQLYEELEAHIANILTLEFSHDGRYLASSGEDRQVTIWAVDQNVLRLLESVSAHTNFVRGLSFSPDDQFLVSGSVDQLAMIWHVGFASFGRLDSTAGALRRVTYSHNGEQLAYSGQDNTVHLVNVADGEDVFTPISSPGSVFAMDFSGDDSMLAYADTLGTLAVVSTESGDTLVTSDAHAGVGIFALAFSPDNAQVASGGLSTDLVLWDLGTDNVQHLSGHGAFIRWIDYSPQGSMIATVAWDGTVILWNRNTAERYPIVTVDTAEGEFDLSFKPHEVDELLYTEFSYHGNYLTTSSSDHTAIVWRLNFQRDGSVRISKVLTLTGHTDWVHAAVFNDQETLVATASQDNKIFLWSLINTQDYSAGEKIAELTGHTDSVNVIDFSPDGLRLASGSTDGDVIIWNIDLANAPAILCEQVNRDLTQEEWVERIANARGYHSTCAEYIGSGLWDIGDISGAGE